MSALSRFALALPLCAAAAMPALASDFWDFSTTFSNAGATYTLAGRTLDGLAGTGPYGITTQLQSFTLTIAGTPPSGINTETIDLLGGRLYDGIVGLGGGSNNQIRNASDTTISFAGNSFSFSQAFYMGVSPWADGELQSYYFVFNNADFFIGNGVTPAFGTYTVNDASVDGLRFVPSTRVQFGRNDTPTAQVVPEINGSGYAYIAFILGALGLWLYSSAGRAREEDVPTAA